MTVDTSKTYLNINDQRAVAGYTADYYSGADCRVYIGDLWVDDIITIQWQLNNAKSPRYSYGHPYFRAVSEGNIIVEGNFVIAFRELGYLTTIMNRIEELKPKASPVLGYYNRPGAEDYVKSPVISAKTIRDVLGDIANKRASHTDFEAICENQEDRIWGVANKRSGMYKWQRPDQFDIIQGKTTKERVPFTYPGKGFDIVILYGDYSVGYAEHTLHSIHDIHITGSNQVLNPNGEPVGEAYTFFARTMDEDATNNTSFIRQFGGGKGNFTELHSSPANLNDPALLSYNKGTVVALGTTSGYYFPGITVKILDRIIDFRNNQTSNNKEFQAGIKKYGYDYWDLVNWADYMVQLVIAPGQKFITDGTGNKFVTVSTGVNIPIVFPIRASDIITNLGSDVFGDKSGYSNVIAEYATDK